MSATTYCLCFSCQLSCNLRKLAIETIPFLRTIMIGFASRTPHDFGLHACPVTQQVLDAACVMATAEPRHEQMLKPISKNLICVSEAWRQWHVARRSHDERGAIGTCVRARVYERWRVRLWACWLSLFLGCASRQAVPAQPLSPHHWLLDAHGGSPSIVTLRCFAAALSSRVCERVAPYRT